MRFRTLDKTKLAASVRQTVAEIQPLESRTLMSGLDNFGTVAADGNDVAFDLMQRVHRVWRDVSTGRLWYAMRNTDFTWGTAIQVDSRKAGGEMSVAVSPQGRPSVAYRDFVDGDLVLSTFNGTSWSRTAIDVAGDVGDHPTLRFSTNGKPYIAYYDRTNGDLKLAWQNNAGNWLNTQLETSGDVGAFNSMLVEQGTGLLRIAYTDATGLRLKYAAQKPDGSWAIRAIDRGTPAGVRFASMTLDGRGMPWIAYYDVRKKDLRVATTADGNSWSSQRVASGGWQGEFANIYLDAAEQLNVLYLNRTLNTINVATLKDTVWSYRFVAVGGENVVAAVSTASEFVFSTTSSLDGKLRTSTKSFDHEYANPSDPAERIISWELISGGLYPVSVRTIGWDIAELGWQQYIDTRFATLRSYGMKRILLHNPFGTDPINEPVYQFDQYILAQQAGLTQVTDTFVDALRPVTESGVEVIAYIGKLWADPDFDNLTDFDQYMDRVMRSIKPLLDAGCSIGFDSIVSATAESRAYMVVEAMRNSGVKVYNENRPPASYGHLLNYNGVYYDNWWIGGNPAVNPESWWAARNEQLTGEILRATMNPPAGYQFHSFGWRRPTIVNILRDGHTAATQYDLLVAEGITLNSLITGAGLPLRSGPSQPPSANIFGGSKVDPENDDILS